MNQEIMQSRWNQLRNEAQLRWNRLTDEDLERTRGQANKLVDVVEERYGVTRQTAQEQVDRFLQQAGSGVQSLRTTANSWWTTSRNFVADNPWTAIVAAVVLLGVVVGVFVRPNMRN